MAEMQPFVDVDLEPNTEALAERAESPASIDGTRPREEAIKLVGKPNRLGLLRGEATGLLYDDGRRTLLDLPLRCMAHAHPECRFRYVRVVAEFAPPEGASDDDLRIEDLSPHDVRGKEPVKITTKYSGKLSFEFQTLKLGPEVAAETSQETNVYFPEITSSGIGFGVAVWDFTAIEPAPLHVDRDLRILVSLPTPWTEFAIDFILEAQVRRQGWLGLIPLIGRKTASFPMRDDFVKVLQRT
jgi:hypothetical protein